MKNKLLSILLSISIIITIIYSSISTSINTKSLKETSRNFVKNGIIYNNDNTYTEIFNTIVKLTTLNEEYIINALKLDYVNDIITDIVNSIYEYNITGNENVKYTKEKIIQLIEENLEKIAKDINYNLNNNDKENILKYTKENIDYIINTIYNTNIGNWRPTNND